MNAHGHVISRAIYYRVFAALIAFTAITVSVAYFDFGLLNTVIAVTIAVLKAVLVILFFMHVRYTDHLTQIFAAAGFFWLVILITFTLSDYLARGMDESPEGWREDLVLPAISDAAPVSHD